MQAGKELTDFTCVTCDSMSAYDCADNPGEQYKLRCNSQKCLTALYNNHSDVFRGCEDDEKNTPPFAGAPDKVEACTDRWNCNDKPIHLERCMRLSYDASGIIRSRSFHELGFERFCPLAFEPMGCFAMIDSKSNSFRSGCALDIAMGRDKRGEHEEMFGCVGADCNAKLSFFTCLSHGPNDQVQLDAAHTDAKLKICSSYDKCFTYLHNEQTAERGCLTQASEEVQAACLRGDAQCTLCDNDVACNRHDAVLGDVADVETPEPEPGSTEPSTADSSDAQVTPITCFKCNSAVDPACLESPSDTCESATGQCSTALYQGYSTLVRGCVGDADADFASAEPDQEVVCSGQANCNGQQLVAEKCHAARYTKNDVLGGVERRWKFPPSKCRAVLEPVGCFYLHAAGRTVRTGCNINLAMGKVKQAASEALETCVGAECNESTTFFTCLAHGPSKSYALDAEDSRVTVDVCKGNDKCFTYKHADTVERGCLSKASPQIGADCATKRGNCFVCDDGIGCNRLDADK